jgi:hypothetical protein
MDSGGFREQKLLEYFASLQLSPVTHTDIVVDVASEWSLFPYVLRRATGARVYRQDIIYPIGLAGDRIGGSADSMSLPDGFASRLFLHNSFEHFENDADRRFMDEAWRVLQPGGQVCIIPLFMAERYTNLTDPLANRAGLTFDDSAYVAELPWWRNRFGRFYDAHALASRVWTPAQTAGFNAVLYHVTNDHEAHRRAFVHFALVLTKPRSE